MSEPKYGVNEQFHIQFVWQLPDGGDYLRAIFKATVNDVEPESEKYIVTLSEFVAGRQESPAGEPRPKDALAEAYWARVRRLRGCKILVAYEAEDGRSLHLRLATLTGEHSFFHRFR